jgi:hypothetical protein
MINSKALRGMGAHGGRLPLLRLWTSALDPVWRTFDYFFGIAAKIGAYWRRPLANRSCQWEREKFVEHRTK